MEDKKGLLKLLKTIEGKNEEHLKIIKGKTDIKSHIDLLGKNATPESFALIKKTKSIKKCWLQKTIFRGVNGKQYDFTSFKTLEELKTFVTKI